MTYSIYTWGQRDLTQCAVVTTCLASSRAPPHTYLNKQILCQAQPLKRFNGNKLPLQDNSQTFLRPCAKLKYNIKKLNCRIGLLKQFGTSWQVSNFFLSHKSLHSTVFITYNSILLCININHDQLEPAFSLTLFQNAILSVNVTL